MPLTLSLNTAAQHVQFGLSRDGVMVCAQTWLTRNDGTELLATALDHACRRLGCAARDIERVACVAGPGSFTGIRLALSTAAGLARANGARQAGLDFMQCLAATVLANPGERVGVLIPAQRGWMYSADYVADEAGLPRLQERIVLLPEPGGIDDLDALSRTVHGDLIVPDYLVGAAVTTHRAFFEVAFPLGTRFLPARYDIPSPAALLALTEAVDWTSDATLHDVEPLYMRDCDAVGNLDHIARERGEDPAHAHAELQRLLSAGL